MGVDGGSAVAITPRTYAKDYPAEQTSESKRGGGCTAANETFIPDEGQTNLMCRVAGWSHDRPMRTRVGGVKKGLIAVSGLVDTAHRVAFDDAGNYAVHKRSGQKIQLRRARGVFEIDFDVSPYRCSLSADRRSRKAFTSGSENASAGGLQTRGRSRGSAWEGGNGRHKGGLTH